MGEMKNTRGEWYVVIQGILFILIVLAPWLVDARVDLPDSVQMGLRMVGIILGIGGLALVVLGIVTLGSNLSPLPQPNEDTTLIQRGVFSIVRHPMYGGAIIAAFGWALIHACLLTLLLSVVLFVFFDIKSRREERMMLRQFPDYAAYRQRVKKLIPFVY
jgi:protein-S-isoprenylcysteine O-methyltransferase Ste14